MMDRNSPTWTALRRKIMERINERRDDLEMVGLDPEPIRGEIAGLRWVIATVEPEAPVLEPILDYMQTTIPDHS